MRTTLLALALLLVACADRDSTSRPSTAGGAATLVQPGPDALVLRVARAGGLVRVYRYPSLDSMVWRSTDAAPPVARLVGFDPELGSLVGVSAAGSPLRIDLRMGRVEVSTFSPVSDAASADGSTLFALARGEVARFTPTGRDWSLPVSATARLFPQADGSLTVATPTATGTRLQVVRPPGTTIEDSTTIDAPMTTGMVAGDRLYLAGGEQLVAVRARNAEAVATIGIGDSVVAAVATPSGDRVIVAAAGTEKLAIVDRFEGKVVERVRLPGAARGVRMDPLGRVVLVQPAVGDSVWIVSLADGSLRGAVASTWREDLPFVGADDRVATLRGRDVVFVSMETLADGATVADGGADYWYPMRWNGFRPRAAGLDQPVRFRAGTMIDSTADSAVSLVGVSDSSAATDSSTPPTPAAPVPPSAPASAAPAAPSSRFYVVLGSVSDAAEARDSASRVQVGGMRGRVLTARSAGGPVQLIVVGPFAARADADQMRRLAGSRAWVTEERP